MTGPVVREQRVLDQQAGVYRCDGCGKGLWIREETHCPRCQQELDALQEWESKRKERLQLRELRKLYRREERRMKRERLAAGLRRAVRWVVKWSWVPNLVLIGGVLVYLAGVYGYACLEWIQLGGIR